MGQILAFHLGFASPGSRQGCSPQRLRAQSALPDSNHPALLLLTHPVSLTHSLLIAPSWCHIRLYRHTAKLLSGLETLPVKCQLMAASFPGKIYPMPTAPRAPCLCERANILQVYTGLPPSAPGIWNRVPVRWRRSVGDPPSHQEGCFCPCAWRLAQNLAHVIGARNHLPQHMLHGSSTPRMQSV